MCPSISLPNLTLTDTMNYVTQGSSDICLKSGNQVFKGFEITGHITKIFGSNNKNMKVVGSLLGWTVIKMTYLVCSQLSKFACS